jgi:hypothetical protein
MRKLRVALVILLLLTFIAASQTVYASTTITPKSMGDALSIGKSKATLGEIEKKLASGNSDIAKANLQLSEYVKFMAKKNIDNVMKNTSSGVKPKPSIKPPTGKGLKVPMTGIGDAIKALGSTDVSLKSPVSMAKSITMPKMVIL